MASLLKPKTYFLLNYLKIYLKHCQSWRMMNVIEKGSGHIVNCIKSMLERLSRIPFTNVILTKFLDGDFRFNMMMVVTFLYVILRQEQNTMK